MRKLSLVQFAPVVGQDTSQIEKLHGSHDLEALFTGHPRTGTPWPSASKYKDVQNYDKDIVHRELQRPVRGAHDLYEVDPRALHSNQPNITRQGVAHYMGDDYEKTGRTFADQHDAGNHYPLIYTRPSRFAGRPAEHVILSGHHRAAAALLQGRSLKARWVEGPFGPPR